MRLHIVSVRDAALAAFARPIFVPALGLAVRSFQDEINRVESEMHKHPADYELYELGFFEEETGVFESVAPRLLARGVEVLLRAPLAEVKRA